MSSDTFSAAALLARPYWIFDLDGTLTRPVHDFVAIRRQLGVPSDEGILEYIQAQPAPRRKALSGALDAIERDLARRSEANEGVLALLEVLEQRGVELAILTRNRRAAVEITLHRLGVHHLFAPACILACDDAPPKPDPAGIHRLLAYWQAPPQQCLIIGDYCFDLEAGVRAGIGTVHFQDDPARHWPELTDLRINHFKELTRILRTLEPLPARPRNRVP
ncbi:HAD family hydrolase [Motiliproteus sp. SC1-56]|uniref:HAD family hydrolase n=1 Tax=Motiliproteus sp. SC1-56 TaxID=2799565 RepID=UPI001A8FA776|nr:HAD family hydrolase [Motiliproteus sp. SC1-56]